MTRVFNFSAGPAVLPEPVLREAAADMLDWHGSGMSVMEMSHRGPEFTAILAEAKALLRELLAVPADYHLLFLQGGGMAENAIVPMNLLRGRAGADYIVTGEWSKRSSEEAAKYGRVNVAASSSKTGFDRIPPRADWLLDPEAAYVHICANETISGVEYQNVPDVGEVPLIADMSSSILSRPVDVSRFGLIYAGAQKNIGPAGVTIVIVRDDLIGQALPVTPSAFDYQLQADAGSMLNTPPTYAIYVAGLVFKWIKAQGGLAAMEARRRAKAGLIYDLLDASGFYTSPVQRADRSLMNIPFHLPDAALDAVFLDGAQERGMVQLKGHRSVGGLRASLYNAMPLEGAQQLANYMIEFESGHG